MPEADDEYEEYVKYLFGRDIAPRITRSPGLGLHDGKFDFTLSRLGAAYATLRLIATRSDAYDLRARALQGLLADTAEGVGRCSYVLDEFGFGTVLDSEYLVLAKGMRAHHLPAEEAELLVRYGFEDVAANLPGILYLVREHADDLAAHGDCPPSSQIHDLLGVLNQAVEDHGRLAEIEKEIVALGQAPKLDSSMMQRLSDEEASKKKPRRWWKGIGQIVRGAGICLTDAVAAAGLSAVVGPPAWVSLISVTIGVGTMIEGGGDLRHE